MLFRYFTAGWILMHVLAGGGVSLNAAHFDDSQSKREEEVGGSQPKKMEKPEPPPGLPKTNKKLEFGSFLSRIGDRYGELAEDLLEKKSKGTSSDILEEVEKEKRVLARLCDKKGKFVGINEKLNQNELDLANVAALSDAVVALENLSRKIEGKVPATIQTLRSQCLDRTQATHRHLRITDAYGKDPEVRKQLAAFEIWGKQLNNWYRSEK